MTKSVSRPARKAQRQEVAKTAMMVASHGRIIEVEIDGKTVKMFAMTASSHQVVISALQTLSRA